MLLPCRSGQPPQPAAARRGNSLRSGMVVISTDRNSSMLPGPVDAGNWLDAVFDDVAKD